MKTYLKKLFIPLLSGLIACNFYSCDSDNEHTAVPVAPILKEIKFPSENDVIPGQVTQINGLGFAKEDVVYLNDETNKKEKIYKNSTFRNYVKRSITRATPFGLFSSIGVGTFSDISYHQKIGENYTKKISVSGEWLSSICMMLENKDSVLLQLHI